MHHAGHFRRIYHELRDWRLTHCLPRGKVGVVQRRSRGASYNEKLTSSPRALLLLSLTSNVDPDKIIELAHRRSAIPLNAEWRMSQ
jgi:hypothetical protein